MINEGPGSHVNQAGGFTAGVRVAVAHPFQRRRQRLADELMVCAVDLNVLVHRSCRITPLRLQQKPYSPEINSLKNRSTPKRAEGPAEWLQAFLGRWR